MMPLSLFLLLGTLSACVLALTIAIWCAVRDLRRMVQRVDAVLPDCAQAVEEGRGALTEARELLARANTATRQVETVIRRTTDAAAGFIGGLRHRGNGKRTQRMGGRHG